MLFFSSLFVFVAVALSAAAQRIAIAEPTTGQTIPAGQNFTVTITESNSLTGRLEVGVGIGYMRCPSGDCGGPSIDNGLGIVTLVSSFNPQYNFSWSPPSGAPYQNFTFSFPEGVSGEVILDAAHFYLLGASGLPTIDIANVTVNVV